MLALTEKPVILVKGFLLSTSLPSESLLTVRFTDKDKINGSGQTIDITKELEEIEPDLLKRFAAIRSRQYRIIEKPQVRGREIPEPPIARRLQKVGQNIVYLVPQDNVLRLYDRWENEILQPLDELEADIRAYLTGNDERLQRVKDYYQEHFERKISFAIPHLRDRAKLRLSPLNIDFQAWKDYLEEQARTGLIEMNETRKRALQQMTDEINTEKERLLRQATLEIQKDVSGILASLTADLAEKNPHLFSQQLIDVRRTAESLGIAPLLEHLFDMTEALIEAKETNSRQAVEKAATILKRSLDIDATEPAEIIQKAATRLNDSLTPEAEQTIREGTTYSRAQALRDELA